MKSLIKLIKSFALMSLVAIGVLCSCDSDNEGGVKLIIEGLSVNEGFFGDQIVIIGTGFSPTASDNLVTFNGAIAEVVSSTPTSITTIVPFPSSTGKITVTTNNEEAPGPIFTLVLPPSEVIAYTSFEEVPTFVGDIFYPKSGTEVLDNIQVTDPTADDPYVDFVATGNELGFDSSFITSDIGDSGVERMGVFSNANMETEPDDFEGRFQDGTQGFVTSDLDGTIEIVFDQVNLTNNMVGVTIEADIYFGDSSYEEFDGINIYYMVDGQLGVPLISYEFEEVNANLSKWINASAQLPIDKIVPGNIVIRMKNGANSEMIFVDRVAIKGVTVN